MCPGVVVSRFTVLRLGARGELGSLIMALLRVLFNFSCMALSNRNLLYKRCFMFFTNLESLWLSCFLFDCILFNAYVIF